MLTINDIGPKSLIMIDDHPYQVLEVHHQHIGRGGSSVQTRIKDLVSGQVYSRNFKPADTFQEADVEKREMQFLYGHRGDFVFIPKNRPSERHTLTKEQVGDAAQWLIPKTPVTALVMDEKILSVTPPIKMDFAVTEAPPNVKGDTASGGNKTVTIETGAKIATPLFIETGDIIRVNTETGTYAERVKKSS